MPRFSSGNCSMNSTEGKAEHEDSSNTSQNERNRNTGSDLAGYIPSPGPNDDSNARGLLRASGTTDDICLLCRIWQFGRSNSPDGDELAQARRPICQCSYCCCHAKIRVAIIEANTSGF